MTIPRILVFDSGVGGLSVAACVNRRLPRISQVYVADNACFPYGDQPETVVIERCLSLIAGALAAWPADVIVVACNTASTVVLPHLRAMTDIPVVGVVPAIKPAAQLSRNCSIGLLATPATVRRPYLDGLIEEFAADCAVERIGHPALVRWVEDFVGGAALPEGELCEVLQPFRDAGVDTVVLGCTHYPLIGEALRRCLPEVRHWVDSGDAIARRTEFLLRQAGLLDQVEVGTTSSGPSPREVEPVVDAALFSGPVPAGIDVFMARLGVPASTVTGHWPAQGNDTRVTTAG